MWYDDKGRARFTQSAEQKFRDAFSYTKYDPLGRPIETGEGIVANVATLATWVDDNSFPLVNTNHVYQTVYSTASAAVYQPGTGGANATQRYLRNRPSVIRSADGSTATHYSYDPHGNVEWIVQYIRGLGENYVRYEYDLISGNMLALYYNEGYGDQLTQRWFYDADNRLASVESSTDGAIWDREAGYRFYQHGPLRRAEYGEDSLQGVDYTYTLQGWLKSINHASLDTTADPAHDGKQVSSSHSKYGMDAFGMALEYFEGDFLRKKSGVGNSPFNSKAVAASYTMRSDHLAITNRSLYNGNIAGWSSNTIAAGGTPPFEYENLTGEVYLYDRLNRLRTSTFSSYTGSWGSNGDYDTRYAYDANGNIDTLIRHGKSKTTGGYFQLDSLLYTYPTLSGDRVQNRLLHVTERIAGATVPLTDYEVRFGVPGVNNFSYDASGRLIADKNEGITHTVWTPYDKVEQVQKNGGTSLLQFAYDAQGNRVKKSSIAGGAGTTTYYVREAGGKVIAIYTKGCIDRDDFVSGGGGRIGCVDPAAPPDFDHDGIPDDTDNAPHSFNPDQRDTDGDGDPDASEADGDTDGDGLFDASSSEPCKYDPTNQCVGDHDSDGIPDGDDPCPDYPGDCSADPDGDNDGDGVVNKEDNCPWTPNHDQTDSDHDGTGDACTCDTHIDESGSCQVDLSEQYVYGSEQDGRVVTIQAARTRDMQLHLDETLFTRDLGAKEYELNDHLGNVRVRFSDVKLSTGTAGTAPFKIDLRGYTNYYPFGMAQPGRTMNIAGGRYGYNGKEMDNDWNDGQAVAGGDGNSYDYGFRMYEPRLGRFLSVDPLAAKYPWYTPYQFAGNMPISAIDVDGLEPAPAASQFNPNPVEKPTDDKFKPTPGKSANQVDIFYFSSNTGIYLGRSLGTPTSAGPTSRGDAQDGQVRIIDPGLWESAHPPADALSGDYGGVNCTNVGAAYSGRGAAIAWQSRHGGAFMALLNASAPLAYSPNYGSEICTTQIKTVMTELYRTLGYDPRDLGEGFVMQNLTTAMASTWQHPGVATLEIKISMEAIGPGRSASTVWDLLNLLVHERGAHGADWLSGVAYDFSAQSRASWERHAVLVQSVHWTWRYTSAHFRDEVDGYRKYLDPQDGVRIFDSFIGTTGR